MFKPKSSDRPAALPFSARRDVSVRALEDAFSPENFWQMQQSDPQAANGRYRDINGPDIGAILNQIEWSYADYPLTVGVFTASNELVAVGFAGAIRLNTKAADSRTKSRRQSAAAPKSGSIDGINLSYAVHSAHEGRGYALLAACLVLQRAQNQWGDALGNGFLNIQTREDNVRGNALLGKLSGGTYSTESAFIAYPRQDESIAFVGTRIPWAQALQRAQVFLQDLDFINHIADGPAQARMLAESSESPCSP